MSPRGNALATLVHTPTFANAQRERKKVEALFAELNNCCCPAKRSGTGRVEKAQCRLHGLGFAGAFLFEEFPKSLNCGRSLRAPLHPVLFSLSQALDDI
jgi:hypothetical protein